MAGEGPTYHNRIADLLDDITVDAEPVSSAAASEPAAEQNGTPPAAPAPDVESSVPATSASTAPDPPVVAAPASASKDDAVSLPPFLRQPAALPEKGSTLPGTSLLRRLRGAVRRAPSSCPPRQPMGMGQILPLFPHCRPPQLPPLPPLPTHQGRHKLHPRQKLAEKYPLRVLIQPPQRQLTPAKPRLFP